MEFKKSMIILIMAIFLVSIAGVCAADANDTMVASDDANQIEVSSNDVTAEDDLQASEENTTLTQANDDETLSAQADSEILSEGEGTYYDLRDEIGSGGDKSLTKRYYSYTGGNTIEITTSGVINGNGAVIDMSGSSIRAFYVDTPDVTIKNLTIKNANYNGGGGAVYFRQTGRVINCNFIDNAATGRGGAFHFYNCGDVTNCNFTGNKISASQICGGALYFAVEGNITNCNFAGNQENYGYGGGAIGLKDGRILNCNFTNNTATDDGGAVYVFGTAFVSNCNFIYNHADYYGGAVEMYYGDVANCNFTNNTANKGGAVYIDYGSVTNCTFVNNNATNNGGAVYIPSGVASNCNFTGNKASGSGGAVYLWKTGDVTNCTFVNNNATNNGGAVYMPSGVASNCNFTGNEANGSGGAVYFDEQGNVTNCTFANNTANDGGAVYMSSGVASNCNFANNHANDGGAIFGFSGESTADTCIFKTDSDSTSGNVIILSPALNVDNFITTYGSGEKLTLDLKTNNSMPVSNGNILISVYYKNNDTWFDDYTCLSGEGWAVDLPVGSYYAIFGTEYEDFKPINRTIKVLPDVQFYVNVTSISSNKRAVNITTKSNIPEDIMEGKLLFILPYGIVIDGDYTADGIWWAEYTFADYGDYPVKASYIGYDKVAINNATVSISKEDSTISLDVPVLEYGTSVSIAVNTTGALGITAEIYEGHMLAVVGNVIIIPDDLEAGPYTLIITTIPDAYHNEIKKTVPIYIQKAKTQFTASAVNATYNINKELVITLTDSQGRQLKDCVVSVDLNGIKNYTTDSNGQITVSTQGLTPKVYSVNIAFEGKGNYDKSNATTTVTINKDSTNLIAEEVTTTYNANKELVISLTDSKGKPISGAKITVNLNGVKTYVTNKNGQIKVPTKGLAAKVYTAKITFNGNANYIGSAKSVKVTVKKATPKLTAKKKTFKKSKKVKKYTVTLKDNTGKAIKKAKVTIKIGKKTYKAKTNAKGKAIFKIKKLTKKGKYKATVKYNGNYLYNKVTKKVKIRIK